MISPEFLITALIVVLAPGTGVIYTLATGLGRGRLASTFAAFGCAFGIAPHLLAAIFRLAALMHTSALLFDLLKFAGVLFLLYMAWQSLREDGPLAISPHTHSTVSARALPMIAVRGALINILNPKLSLFFLAFLPQFLTSNPATATGEMIKLGLIFMLMTFVVFVVYGIFAAAARTPVLQSPAIMKILRYGFAAAFAGLGLKLALEST